MTGELQAKGGIFVPFPSRTKNPLAMTLNMRRLAQLIAAERADIVHVRSRALAWVAYGATRMTKTPLVTTFHSGCQGSNPVTLRYNSVLARGDVVLADLGFAAVSPASSTRRRREKSISFIKASIAGFSRRTRSRRPVFRRCGGIGRPRRTSKSCFWPRQRIPPERPKILIAGGGSFAAEWSDRRKIHPRL